MDEKGSSEIQLENEWLDFILTETPRTPEMTICFGYPSPAEEECPNSVGVVSEESSNVKQLKETIAKEVEDPYYFDEAEEEKSHDRQLKQAIAEEKSHQSNLQSQKRKRINGQDDSYPDQQDTNPQETELHSKKLKVQTEAISLLQQRLERCIAHLTDTNIQTPTLLLTLEENLSHFLVMLRKLDFQEVSLPFSSLLCVDPCKRCDYIRSNVNQNEDAKSQSFQNGYQTITQSLLPGAKIYSDAAPPVLGEDCQEIQLSRAQIKWENVQSWRKAWISSVLKRIKQHLRNLKNKPFQASLLSQLMEQHLSLFEYELNTQKTAQNATKELRNGHCGVAESKFTENQISGSSGKTDVNFRKESSSPELRNNHFKKRCIAQFELQTEGCQERKTEFPDGNDCITENTLQQQNKDDVISVAMQLASEYVKILTSYIDYELQKIDEKRKKLGRRKKKPPKIWRIDQVETSGTVKMTLKYCGITSSPESPNETVQSVKQIQSVNEEPVTQIQSINEESVKEIQSLKEDNTPKFSATAQNAEEQFTVTTELYNNHLKYDMRFKPPDKNVEIVPSILPNDQCAKEQISQCSSSSVAECQNEATTYDKVRKELEELDNSCERIIIQNSESEKETEILTILQSLLQNNYPPVSEPLSTVTCSNPFEDTTQNNLQSMNSQSNDAPAMHSNDRIENQQIVTLELLPVSPIPLSSNSNPSRYVPPHESFSTPADIKNYAQPSTCSSRNVKLDSAQRYEMITPPLEAPNLRAIVNASTENGRNIHCSEYVKLQNIPRRGINTAVNHVNNISAESRKFSVPFSASHQNNLGNKLLKNYTPILPKLSANMSSDSANCQTPRLQINTGYSNISPVHFSSLGLQNYHNANGIIYNFNPNGIVNGGQNISNILKPQSPLIIMQPSQHMTYLPNFPNDITFQTQLQQNNGNSTLDKNKTGTYNFTDPENLAFNRPYNNNSGNTSGENILNSSQTICRPSNGTTNAANQTSGLVITNITTPLNNNFVENLRIFNVPSQTIQNSFTLPVYSSSNYLGNNMQLDSADQTFFRDAVFQSRLPNLPAVTNPSDTLHNNTIRNAETTSGTNVAVVNSMQQAKQEKSNIHATESGNSLNPRLPNTTLYGAACKALENSNKEHQISKPNIHLSGGTVTVREVAVGNELLNSQTSPPKRRGRKPNIPTNNGTANYNTAATNKGEVASHNKFLNSQIPFPKHRGRKPNIATNNGTASKNTATTNNGSASNNTATTSNGTASNNIATTNNGQIASDNELLNAQTLVPKRIARPPKIATNNGIASNNNNNNTSATNNGTASNNTATTNNGQVASDNELLNSHIYVIKHRGRPSKIATNNETASNNTATTNNGQVASNNERKGRLPKITTNNGTASNNKAATNNGTASNITSSGERTTSVFHSDSNSSKFNQIPYRLPPFSVLTKNSNSTVPFPYTISTTLNNESAASSSSLSHPLTTSGNSVSGRHSFKIPPSFTASAPNIRSDSHNKIIQIPYAVKSFSNLTTSNVSEEQTFTDTDWSNNSTKKDISGEPSPVVPHPLINSAVNSISGGPPAAVPHQLTNSAVNSTSGGPSSVSQTSSCQESSCPCNSDPVHREIKAEEREKMDALTRHTIALVEKHDCSLFFKMVSKYAYPVQHHRLLRRLWEDAHVLDYYLTTGRHVSPDMKQQILHNNPLPETIRKSET